jgi:hypothetical protein
MQPVKVTGICGMGMPSPSIFIFMVYSQSPGLIDGAAQAGSAGAKVSSRNAIKILPQTADPPGSDFNR